MTRCSTCGYRIRGKNHNEGSHHTQPDKRRTREKVLAKRRKAK